MDGGAWWAAVHGVARSQTQLSNFTFTFHFHALKEMATHSSVLAWKIPGTGEPGGLPSTGSQSQTWLKWCNSSTNRKVSVCKKISPCLINKLLKGKICSFYMYKIFSIIVLKHICMKLLGFRVDYVGESNPFEMKNYVPQKLILLSQYGF